MSGVDIQKPTSARPAIGYKLQNNPFFANDKPKTDDVKKSRSSIVGRRTSNIPTQRKRSPAPQQTKLAKPSLSARTTEDSPARRPSLRKVNAVTNNPWKERNVASSKLSTSTSLTTASASPKSPLNKAGSTPRGQETKLVVPTTTTTTTIPTPTTPTTPTMPITPTTTSTLRQNKSTPTPASTSKTATPIVPKSPSIPTTKLKKRASVSKPANAATTEQIPRTPPSSQPTPIRSPCIKPKPNRDLEEAHEEEVPVDLSIGPSWPQHKTEAGLAGAHQGLTREILDLDEMIHQLTITHAIQSAVHFPILTLEEADAVKKEQDYALASVRHVRSRIKKESYSQRAMASLLRISDTSQGETASSWRESSTKMDAMVDELMNTFTSTMKTQLHWLQHVAGTLATAMQRGLHQESDARPTSHERISGPSNMLDQLLSRLDSVARRHAPSASKTTNGRIGSVSDDGSLSDDSVFSKSVRTSVTSLESSAAQHQQQHKLAMGHTLIDAIERQLSEHERLASPKPAHAEANLQAMLDKEERQREQLEARLIEEQHETDSLRKALEHETRQRKTLETALAALRDEQTDQEHRWHRERQENDRLHTQLRSEQRQRQAEQDALLNQCSAMLAHKPKTLTEAVHQLVQTVQSRPEKPANDDAHAHLLTELSRHQRMLEEQQTRLDTAQDEFTQRESAYLLQSASTEAELAQVLKEYDRLTRSINDSNVERKKYEQRILEQSRELSRLDKALADEKMKGLGQDGQSLTLRKEFRQLMANAKVEHQQALEREMQARQLVEQSLREAKREMELKRWDRVDKSMQTNFCV